MMTPRLALLPLLLTLMFSPGCTKAPVERATSASATTVDGAQPAAPVLVDVDAKRFQALIAQKNGILLDVRTPGEVARGRIAGTVAINVFDKDFDAKISLLQKDKPILVYCASGRRSVTAGNRLIAAGFKDVYNLLGGIQGWGRAGMAVERGPAPH